MDNVTIPPEALEAFQKAWANRDTLSTSECLVAMLKAWPGMELDEAMWSGGPSFIILPLNTETSDDK
jgi:hypothetical protein